MSLSSPARPPSLQSQLVYQEASLGAEPRQLRSLLSEIQRRPRGPAGPAGPAQLRESRDLQLVPTSTDMEDKTASAAPAAEHSNNHMTVITQILRRRPSKPRTCCNRTKSLQGCDQGQVHSRAWLRGGSGGPGGRLVPTHLLNV